jgi:dihydroorotate dehydrogenase electron transfer subunit
VKVTQAFLEGVEPFGPGLLIHLKWPPLTNLCAPGQFFLVRCTPSPDLWDPYLRRALFAALIAPGHLALWLTDANDRGLAWLIAQPAGTRLDLLGPGGHGFDVPPTPGNVLLVAQALVAQALVAQALVAQDLVAQALVAQDGGIGPLWSVMAQALAAGGQATLALGTPRGDLAVPPTLVPVAAEYRLATADGSAGLKGNVFALLDGLAGWPDRIYAVLPQGDWPRLRTWIESWRPHVERGFAQVLAPADIRCGTGACLACVVERADGRWTRACVHGPVLDLTVLT